MPKIYKILAAVVAATGALFCLFYILYYFIFTISAADPSTRSAIIAALAAGSVALVSNAFQKRKDINLKQREQKIPAYEKILDMIKEIFLKIKNKEDLSEKELISQLYEIHKSLLMAGSADVVLAWKNYYQWLTEQTLETTEVPDNDRIREMRLGLARVVRAIRKDLNHNDSALTDSDIADLIIPLDSETRKLLH